MCLTMDKSWMKLRNKLSVEYREGVSQFLEMESRQMEEMMKKIEELSRTQGRS